MASEPELAIVAAYLARYNRLRLTAGATVGQLWDRYAAIDDEDRFAIRAAQLATAAQGVALAGLVGYLSALFAAVGEPPALPPVDPELVVGGAARAGSVPLEVYRRGIVTARTATTKGRTLVEAMAAGRARMVSTAETDVALTQRAGIVQLLQHDERVVGYRRVLTGRSCAFCAVASTQRYHRAELMPLHSHCDCGVVPIVGSRDPGRVINRPLLADIKSARGQGATDRRLAVDEDGTVHLPEIAVHQHGELGPVLGARGDHFTGEDDIAA